MVVVAAAAAPAAAAAFSSDTGLHQQQILHVPISLIPFFHPCHIHRFPNFDFPFSIFAISRFRCIPNLWMGLLISHPN